eukprot:TRINITY_DN12731_c0_g2_i4.p1 TRINITY_DN12731_c0_g2~~TRINITY_DN12731_c0_g2_i4.p1  ORF type:complete len:281 (+),score=64.73 TRINITY_DN12731_c0_g2_i4:79-921(+)
MCIRDRCFPEMQAQTKNGELNLIRNFPDPAEYLIGFVWDSESSKEFAHEAVSFSGSKPKAEQSIRAKIKSSISKRTMSPEEIANFTSPAHKEKNAFRVLAKRNKFSYDLALDGPLSHESPSEVCSGRQKSLSPTNGKKSKHEALLNRDIVLLTGRIKKGDKLQSEFFKSKLKFPHKLCYLKKTPQSKTPHDMLKKTHSPQHLSTCKNAQQDKAHKEPADKEAKVRIKNAKISLWNRNCTLPDVRVDAVEVLPNAQRSVGLTVKSGDVVSAGEGDVPGKCC